MSDGPDKTAIERIQEIDSERESLKEEIKSQIRSGEILSLEDSQLVEAINTVYNHSGDQSERLYTSLFFQRVQRLADAGHNVSTRVNTIRTCIRVGDEDLLLLAAYLAASSDSSYQSMLSMNIEQ